MRTKDLKRLILRIFVNNKLTFVTYLYQYTKNLKFVSMMLGHTKTSNTDKYVHVAECIERQLNGNLFNRALKPHNFGYVREQPKNKKLNNCPLSN